MAFIGSLITAVKADTNPFAKNLKKAGRATKKLRSDLFALSKSALKFGGVIAIGLAGVGIAALKLASDFEEADQKFGVVFRGVADKSTMMRDLLVKDFGLSKTAATELLSSTGDLLTGFGFTDDAALELSNSVQELAVDLASFNNLQGGSARASEIITKALLGERDSLISLGVKISEADLQQRLLLKGQKELTGTALRAAKAQATYELIVEQTTKAQGDFSRSSGSMANLIKTSTARMNDLVTSFGQKLLPVATVAVEKFLKLEESTLAWVVANEKLLDTKIDEFLKDVLLTIGKTVDQLNLVRAGWNFLSIGIKSAAGALAGFAGQEDIQNELRKSAIEDLEEMETAFSIFENGVNESTAKEVFDKLSTSIKESKKEIDSLTEAEKSQNKQAEMSNETIKESLKLRAEAIKLEKEQAEEHKKVISEAMKIFEETRTPLEKVRAEIEKIIELMSKGLEGELQTGLQRKLDQLEKERSKLEADKDQGIQRVVGGDLADVGEEAGRVLEKAKSPFEAILERAEALASTFKEGPGDTIRAGGFRQVDLKNIDIAGLERTMGLEQKQLSEATQTNVNLRELISVVDKSTNQLAVTV